MHIHILLDITPFQTQHHNISRNQHRSGSGIIFEHWSDLLLSLVVPRETVDPRLDKDKPKLGVAVFPVGLEMFADSNRLFDEVGARGPQGWMGQVLFPNKKVIVAVRV